MSHKLSTKILSSLVFSALVFSPLSSLAQTHSWVQVAQTADGDRVYVNASSIRKNPYGRFPSTQYWMQKIYGRTTPLGEVRSQTLVSAYCTVNMYRIETNISYDKSNQIVKYFESGTQRNPGYATPEPVPPNSIGESAVRYACER